MENVFRNRLTNDFSYASAETMLPQEIITLRESVGWRGDTLERWQHIVDESLYSIGVCNEDGTLIGMGCLVGNTRHAVLCDLCVNPTYQRLGIGESIMHKLYEVINQRDILYVYAELSDINPFKNRMLSSGFRQTDNSVFWSKYI